MTNQASVGESTSGAHFAWEKDHCEYSEFKEKKRVTYIKNSNIKYNE